MKTVLFVHNFPPEFTGGTEQVVLALARSFEAEGDRVLVVSGSERFIEGGKISEERTGGLRVLRLHRDPSETYGLCPIYPRLGEAITDLLSTERPDTVHVHHWSTLGWDLLQRAAAMGIRGGATLHDLWTCCPRYFRRPPGGIRCPEDAGRGECYSCVGREMGGPSEASMEQSWAERDRGLLRELSLATFLSVPSMATARLLSRHLPMDEGRFRVIPHGLLRPPKARASPRDEKEPIRVGSFGNLVPEKGLEVLIEALAELGDRIELRLTGRVPDPAFRRRLLRLAEAHAVPLVLEGPYGPEDPHPALELDLAVFPSLCQESYGLAVEEALAHGVPVVVANRGALPERVSKGGGLVVGSGGVLPLRVVLSKVLRSRNELEELRRRIPRDFPRIEETARRFRELLVEAMQTLDSPVE